jgi:hypothetical protein
MDAFARAATGLALTLLLAMPAAFAQGTARDATVAQAQIAQKSDRKKTPRKSAQPSQSKAKAQPPQRASFSAEDQARATVPGIPDARFWGDETAAFMAALGPAKGPLLALSGGGEGGAFGAGILAGLTDSGKRPEFAAITGVSTGALIAPFTFAGAKYDRQLRDHVISITAADVFEFGGTPESLLDTWPLKDTVTKRITPALLADIAVQHRNGRRLFVVTTNLDAGRPVVWNMGAIASAGNEAALKLFRDVLLASSSIPGVFPPVQIAVEANGRKFSEMHGDGTINAPFFAVPEPMLAGAAMAPLAGRDIYVIVNGQLNTEFRVIDRDRLSILGRSIGLALDFGLRTLIARVHAAAKRNGVAFKVAYVDPTFDFPWSGMFDSKYMQALFDRGYARAKSGTVFRNDLP